MQLKLKRACDSKTLETKAPGETFQLHVAVFLIVELAVAFSVARWEEQHLMTAAVLDSKIIEGLPKNGGNGCECTS